MQRVLSTVKASETASLSGRDKKNPRLQAILCLTLTTCAGVPRTFWPSPHWEALARPPHQPWSGKEPKALPGSVPPTGNQVLIHRRAGRVGEVRCRLQRGVLRNTALAAAGPRAG